MEDMMFDSELELESDSKPRCSRTTMAILGAVGLIALLLVALLGAFLVYDYMGSHNRYKTCEPSMAKGTKCELYVTDIRPTQFTVGIQEIKCKTLEIEEAYDPSRKHPYLNPDKPVPAVVGLNEFYLVDHHHLCRAILNARFESKFKYVVVEVAQNWNAMSADEFWASMLQNGYIWSVDEKGNMPLQQNALPRTIELTINDPFRTLAYLVRSVGGYAKTKTLYQDSIWANFFRERLSLNVSNPTIISSTAPSLSPWSYCQMNPYGSTCLPDEVEQLHVLLPLAFELARSADASTLPGYTPDGKPFEPNESIYCTEGDAFFSAGHRKRASTLPAHQ